MCKITARIEIEIKTATFSELELDYSLAISHYQIARYHAKKLRMNGLVGLLNKRIDVCSVDLDDDEELYTIVDLKAAKQQRRDECRVKFS